MGTAAPPVCPASCLCAGLFSIGSHPSGQAVATNVEISGLQQTHIIAAMCLLSNSLGPLHMLLDFIMVCPVGKGRFDYQKGRDCDLLKRFRISSRAMKHTLDLPCHRSSWMSKTVSLREEKPSGGTALQSRLSYPYPCFSCSIHLSPWCMPAGQPS